ncbi:AGE family epimerase/isomerase [Aestuariibacter sp. A3R04]|uniref:AGE family epimerase/isomerase n=1 Tax=Aestuariibacter sp. A3R04 TaxID=2841571 RepID=UPI001C09FB09|nr:AGE family epimerase/isomerase [Aestuariibacter sp. A3R04]MBU3023805.1 AGE family epimerase/isomerase [Aestuariibacter sp. A3R04]
MTIAARKFNDRLTGHQVDAQLTAIASWWKRHSIDNEHGGFYGEVDNQSKPVRAASKGIVLNTRILWFFSEYARHTQLAEDRAMADRAYQYLTEYFVDQQYGGLVWELSASGAIINGKKQVYAQCFGIYALCSYFTLSQSEDALKLAQILFRLVENFARDHNAGGYIEACSREWGKITDFRLSEKDLNSPKSMNTHLHVLEAYTALHQVDASPTTQEALDHVMAVFLDRVVVQDKQHLALFFDMDWQSQFDRLSFGHDIEASWLLCEAAEVLQNPAVSERTQQVAIALAESCLRKGVASKGYVIDEYDSATETLGEHSHWWVQAEALVGFLNAYTLTGEQRYREVCDRIWRYIMAEHVDDGEWLWLARSHGGKNQDYKAGFWKGPYHNGRAMLELKRRLVAEGY